LSGNINVTISQDLSLSMATDLKNTPMTSVIVKRSVQHIKKMITDCRINFTPENLKQYHTIILYSLKILYNIVIFFFYYFNVFHIK